MRRAFSILLVLFFGLGPLSATLEADDARLPACCRSHGAHHCAMSAALKAWMLRTESQTPGFTAPSTCPLYRTFFDQDTAPEHAFLPLPNELPAPAVHAILPVAHRPVPRGAGRTVRTVRGPPVSIPTEL